MITGLIGIKTKQTQQFTEDGKRIPVTHITAGPSWVTQVIDTPNHVKLQLGFGTQRNLPKAQLGHLKKAGLEQKLRFLHEFIVRGEGETPTVGAQVSESDVFAAGDAVRATGVSKGKGFAGVVKRHGFAGMPKTHGTSDRERAPGSIGQTTTPGRVYRGKRMAGRMGNDTITVRGLTVMSVDTEKHIIVVKGLVPGAIGAKIVLEKE